jgi:predicted amidohydrolase YtcJ
MFDDLSIRKEKADMVLLNGNLITVDPGDTIAEAVAVKGNKILKVGSSENIQGLIGDGTEVIYLGGRAVLPGFVDSHTHAESYCLNHKYRLKVHVPPLKSVREVLEKVKKKAKEIPKGEWIVCRGSFHLDHKYDEKRYPTRVELDEAAPDHPVVMFSGAHIAVVNSMALEESGITRETPRLVKLPGHVVLVEKDPRQGSPQG